MRGTHSGHTAKRKDILGDDGETADKGMFAHPAKLMNPTERTDCDKVIYCDMAGQCGGVNKYCLIPHKTVMAHM
ncbi:hypothetical protein ES703_39230 [subsurface metagenome]